MTVSIITRQYPDFLAKLEQISVEAQLPATKQGGEVVISEASGDETVTLLTLQNSAQLATLCNHQQLRGEETYGVCLASAATVDFFLTIWSPPSLKDLRCCNLTFIRAKAFIILPAKNCLD